MHHRAWMVRPPKDGCFDEQAARDEIITGEFGVRGDFSDHFEYEMILSEVEESSAGLTQRKLENRAKQLDLLLRAMDEGDLVLHPMPGRKTFMIGVTGSEILQDSDGRPARKVSWIASDIPKEALQTDLHYSASAGNQISQLLRDNAFQRLEAIVQSGRDPGPALAMRDQNKTVDLLTIETVLHDRMLSQVGAAFAGHDLAELVAALLAVDGYHCHVSPPGPDGGCDLLASKGSLGIEGPTIAGQVKSGDIVGTDLVLQALRGVIDARGATNGLLVCWSGVTKPVAKELDRLRLKIAFWDAHEICARLVRNYNEMPLWVRDRVRLRMLPVLDAG